MSGSLAVNNYIVSRLYKHNRLSSFKFQVCGLGQTSAIHYEWLRHVETWSVSRRTAQHEIFNLSQLILVRNALIHS